MSDREEWADDGLDDREFPDEDDYADDDENLTEECPRCGADIYEDATQCPLCGTYLTSTGRPWSARPWWWIALGLAGIAALLWTLLLAGF